MTDQKVSEKEMIAYLDEKIREHEAKAEALHGEWIRGEGDILKAIRAFIKERGRLRQFINELKVEAKLAWNGTSGDIAKLVLKARDFKLDGDAAPPGKENRDDLSRIF